jgi:hypothetical protein
MAGVVAVGRLVVAGGVVGAVTHHAAWSLDALAGAVMLVLATGADARDWFGRPRV